VCRFFGIFRLPFQTDYLNQIGPRKPGQVTQALTRKNALFAGSDGGAQHWACLASLIETAKLNGVDPLAYLTDGLALLARGYPINRVAELLPWRRAPQTSTVVPA
jgi:hypothetical protein